MMQTAMFSKDGTATREAMMYAATDHADRVSPGWPEVAYHFLENYCRTHEIVTGEEVTAAAREWGLSEPPTTRAWGSLYIKAQNAGVVRWKDNDAKRYNGSPAPRYTSLVFKGVA